MLTAATSAPDNGAGSRDAHVSDASGSREGLFHAHHQAHSSDPLSVIRLALGADQQLIRVSDSTRGETYDITLSPSTPFASPYVTHPADHQNASDATSTEHLRTPGSTRSRRRAPLWWLYGGSSEAGSAGGDVQATPIGQAAQAGRAAQAGQAAPSAPTEPPAAQADAKQDASATASVAAASAAAAAAESAHGHPASAVPRIEEEPTPPAPKELAPPAREARAPAAPAGPSARVAPPEEKQVASTIPPAVPAPATTAQMAQLASPITTDLPMLEGPRTPVSPAQALPMRYFSQSAMSTSPQHYAGSDGALSRSPPQRRPSLRGSASGGPGAGSPPARLRPGTSMSASSAQGSEHAQTFDEEMAQNADMLRRSRRAKEQSMMGGSGDSAQQAPTGDTFPAGSAMAAAAGKHKEPHRESHKEQKEERDPPVSMGNLIGEGHTNYVLMYHMLTGIRIGVSRCWARPKTPLTNEDFSAKYKFTFDIIGNELAPSSNYDFKFKDYAPAVFRELRENFHLDTADYLLSLTAKYILSELGSPGKSGSFFYFSRDYRFIIKTIRHREHKFLMKILKAYYMHVRENPHTLLSQFYGLHRVKLPGGRKIHFVVMNNLFPPHRDVHEMYDLKGSVAHREQTSNNKGAVLKDMNWIKRGRSIELGPEKREQFVRQLRSDVALLMRLKIMDYSLLIGLHDLRLGNRDNLLHDALQVAQPEADVQPTRPTPRRQRSRSASANSQAAAGGGAPGGGPQPPPMLRRPSIVVSSNPGAELAQGGPEARAEGPPVSPTEKSGAGAPGGGGGSTVRAAVVGPDNKVLSAQTATKLPNKTAERRHFIFYQDEGGLRSTDEQNQPTSYIYYLGIIDLFTTYNAVKRGEHLLKGLVDGRHNISAVPPREYGERFVNFLLARRPKARGEREKSGSKPPH